MKCVHQVSREQSGTREKSGQAVGTYRGCLGEPEMSLVGRCKFGPPRHHLLSMELAQMRSQGADQSQT